MVPQQLIDYVFEKSQGNPFFVGELLQVREGSMVLRSCYAALVG